MSFCEYYYSELSLWSGMRYAELDSEVNASGAGESGFNFRCGAHLRGRQRGVQDETCFFLLFLAQSALEKA